MWGAEDMSAVLEAYPEYRLQAGNTAKHLILMSELQRVVDSRRLMAVSQTEQELACASSQAAAFEVRRGHVTISFLFLMGRGGAGCSVSAWYRRGE